MQKDKILEAAAAYHRLVEQLIVEFGDEFDGGLICDCGQKIKKLIK